MRANEEQPSSDWKREERKGNEVTGIGWAPWCLDSKTTDKPESNFQRHFSTLPTNDETATSFHLRRQLAISPRALIRVRLLWDEPLFFRLPKHAQFPCGFSITQTASANTLPQMDSARRGQHPLRKVHATSLGQVETRLQILKC
jgi:hypothetical protein